MKYNDLKDILSENDYTVTVLPTGIVVRHSHLNVEGSGLPSFDPECEIKTVNDAVIDRKDVGNYRILHRVPNAISNIVRKFANTSLEDRKTPTNIFVAIAGKDLTDDDVYSVYTKHLEVDDDTQIDDMKNSDNFHLSNAQVSKLKTVLRGEGLPEPLIIDMRDVDQALNRDAVDED